VAVTAIITAPFLWLLWRGEPAGSSAVRHVPADVLSEPEQRPSLVRRDRAREIWAGLPLGFEANHGQIDQTVRFIARGDGFELFLTPNEAIFSATPPIKRGEQPTTRVKHTPTTAKISVVRMQFVGAVGPVEPVGADPLPGRTNYLIGPEERWTRDVMSYREVRYPSVWKGIDVVFHGRRQVTEYDFDVAAGVDVGTIEIAFAGADHVEIDPRGNLIMTVDGERRTHRAPRVLQRSQGESVELAGRFVLRGGNQVGFEVDGRDPSLPVLIDPEVVYLTDFFGGPDNDNVFSIDVARDGSAILAGYTLSPTWPGTGASSYQQTNQAGEPFRGAGLVAKLAPDGSLEWTTFLAGTGEDNKIWKVATDERGFAHVCGATNSHDFPTTRNAHSRVNGGSYDAVMSVLNPQGSSLVYSSYIGGSGDEFFFGCAIMQEPGGRGQGRGRLLMAAAGYTSSPDFPFVNAADTQIDGGIDAVVTVVDPTEGRIVYSSLLRGSTFDEIAEDVEARESTLAIVGRTFGGARPAEIHWHHAVEGGRGVAQVSGSQPFWVNPPGYGNGWVQHLTKAFVLPAGIVRADLVARWETEESFDFLRLRVSADGGATWDVLEELDGFSAGFETRTVDLSAYAGDTVLIQLEFTSDGFVSDQDGFIDTNGSAVDSVAISGHPIDDFETDLDGWTPSDGRTFFQADINHGPTGQSDAIIAVVNPFAPAAQSIRVAALGGLGFDEGYGIDWSPDGTIVIGGLTATVTFPTTPGAFQTTRPGLGNLFVSRISADLSTLIASTYLGGNRSEFLNGLAVDATGRPVITGFSTSPTYPLVDPLDLSPPFGSGGDRDYILTILSADLSAVEHSSKFGDAGWELGAEVVIGPEGAIYALGRHRTGLEESGATTDIFVLKVQP
jgi:hypothetical protein